MSFERIVPGTAEWEAFYANHLHRYLFAGERLSRRSARNKILDAACGVGYGTRHLADKLGTQVVGVDRDPGALAVAKRDFLSDRVLFLQDDCETLEAARAHGPFDAVVSFETLEHLKRPEEFLHAILSNLTADGTVLVSVPNGDVSSCADWEFHERDFTANDLQELLSSAGFQRIELFGQYMTPLGHLREQIRAEIHRIRFNPLFRFGAWLQARLRGYRLPPALPEQLEDFEIKPISAETIRGQGKQGPFVIIASARRAS